MNFTMKSKEEINVKKNKAISRPHIGFSIFSFLCIDDYGYSYIINQKKMPSFCNSYWKLICKFMLKQNR